MILVNRKIPTTTNPTMAMVPEITFPKYNPARTAATATRIALSVVPMFAFIRLNF
jgi:hypothetical protein